MNLIGVMAGLSIAGITMWGSMEVNSNINKQKKEYSQVLTLIEKQVLVNSFVTREDRKCDLSFKNSGTGLNIVETLGLEQNFDEIAFKTDSMTTSQNIIRLTKAEEEQFDPNLNLKLINLIGMKKNSDGVSFKKYLVEINFRYKQKGKVRIVYDGSFYTTAFLNPSDSSLRFCLDQEKSAFDMFCYRIGGVSAGGNCNITCNPGEYLESVSTNSKVCRTLPTY